MIGLAVFGPDIENRFGSSNFLKIYIISGILAGVSHILFIYNPVVGASGAVWSLMVMYALYNPERIFHIYFFIPAKIKYIVSVFFIIELYLSILGSDSVSHVAHIGGALTGFIFYRLNKNIV
jgi:membrane associated rhomboid family serine protease